MIRQLLVLLTLCISLSLTLGGCSKDEGGGSDQILGKWFLDRYVVYSGTDGAILDDEEATGCSKKEYVEFLPDGKCTQWSSAGAEGNCDEFSSGATNYRYEASAKKITLVHNGGTPTEFEAEYAVYSISTAELQLAGQEEDMDYDNDGRDDHFVSVYVKH